MSIDVIEPDNVRLNRSGRGRRRLVGIVVWITVLSGPMLGSVALYTSMNRDPVQRMPQFGVEGVAETAVREHLASQPGHIAEWILPRGHWARPVINEETSTTFSDATVNQPEVVVTDVTAVYAVPAGPGQWGVIVAVTRGGAREGWQVTVRETSVGPVVQSLPFPVGLLPAPAVGVPPSGVLSYPDDDALSETVAAFLDAYFGVTGDPARYLQSGREVPPLEQDIVDVRVTRVTSRRSRSQGSSSSAPTTVVVEAVVTRQDGAAHLVQIPLSMQWQNNRWEVLRILPGVPLTTS